MNGGLKVSLLAEEGMLAKLEAEVEKVRGPYEEPVLTIAEMTRCQCDTVDGALHHDFQDLDVEITTQPIRLDKFAWLEEPLDCCSIFNPEFETPRSRNTVISGTFRSS